MREPRLMERERSRAGTFWRTIKKCPHRRMGDRLLLCSLCRLPRPRLNPHCSHVLPGSGWPRSQSGFTLLLISRGPCMSLFLILWLSAPLFSLSLHLVSGRLGERITRSAWRGPRTSHLNFFSTEDLLIQKLGIRSCRFHIWSFVLLRWYLYTGCVYIFIAMILGELKGWRLLCASYCGGQARSVLLDRLLLNFRIPYLRFLYFAQHSKVVKLKNHLKIVTSGGTSREIPAVPF